ncbi:cAMP-binding domain of CRP or a regulatory subunit of cAMP-dependent protein kinases [Arenibacter troitsensis]|uniref:cAMP-binding domain of CRP or a regulatory subunit of cAMP-dependent protein kinases n=1 Tax=Arenibacter troitsensis TaxID=188872 RepID=A0A1X7I4G7_9FLAO|nr:Crp/Fnr family transcriptional regulator [Arenibacter troitsensis]SMG08935.1 cAMP-binding domain of CRP or a regulatory subunit of cAMP-dependent protein kinases [Arenibacter troitsensis]
MSAPNRLHLNLFILIYLNEIVPLSAELKSFLTNKIKRTVYAKNEIISKEGEICNKLYVIKKGLVRGYCVSDNVDVTTWISFDSEIFTSITGFFKNEPASENIQCLEVTHCEYLEFRDYQYCLKNFPEMREINRIMLVEYYIHAEKRAFMTRIPSAQKRLAYFFKNANPKMTKRIPKKYLASFLAMRPETLSRLFNE